MNLRQIDLFLTRHTAGWKPFSGDFRISKGGLKKGFDPYTSFFSKYTPIGGFGTVESAFRHGDPDSPAGSLAGAVGYKTPAAKGEQQGLDAKADAAAAADIRQAEFEASAKAGLERLALKRKRGFGQSMLVDPGSSLGASSTLGS